MFVPPFIQRSDRNDNMNDRYLRTAGRQLAKGAAIVLAGMLLFGRCANQGMPTGGPRDSIPPFLVETLPAMRSTGFTGKEVRLTFNEYIVPDQVSEELVVSPPLAKRPSVRTKSKSLIVSFNEELKPGRTYSMDFKNSVVDNNERNPYQGLRLLFSTGDQVDTLRVAGMVKDGARLDPLEKIIVMLYASSEDTAVTRTIPDYIARTDSRGLFLFDNIKPGSYSLYAVNDANNNLRYDPGAEEFAFCDSLVVPTAEFVAQPDTLAVGADSLLITGHTLFRPDPIYLRTFTEHFFEQFLNKSVRDNRYKSTFVFGEPVKDTLGLRLLNHTAEDWYLIENNPEWDSLTVWITDTLVARMDTLQLEISYNQRDSLQQTFLQRDTVDMVFTEKEKQETRRRKKEDGTPQVTLFNFTDNIKGGGFDLNLPILLQTPEPVDRFDFKTISLFHLKEKDTIQVQPVITRDTTEWRTYRIAFPWEAETSYLLEIDSAACTNIYGVASQKVKKQFTTQKEDYYGRIILNLTAAEENVIAQLLDNSKEEKVLRTIAARGEKQVTFDYLSPAKYKVRVFFDRNGNGQWDPGVFASRLQPERVAYLPEIVKVRSNWDNQYQWDLKPDPTFRKILIDKEEEELRLKQQQEQNRRDSEREREVPDSEQGFPMPGRM